MPCTLCGVYPVFGSIRATGKPVRYKRECSCGTSLESADMQCLVQAWNERADLPARGVVFRRIPKRSNGRLTSCGTESARRWMRK